MHHILSLVKKEIRCPPGLHSSYTISAPAGGILCEARFTTQWTTLHMHFFPMASRAGFIGRLWGKNPIELLPCSLSQSESPPLSMHSAVTQHPSSTSLPLDPEAEGKHTRPTDRPRSDQVNQSIARSVSLISPVAILSALSCRRDLFRGQRRPRSAAATAAGRCHLCGGVDPHDRGNSQLGQRRRHGRRGRDRRPCRRCRRGRPCRCPDASK